MARVGRKQINVEKKRLIGARNSAASNKRLQVKVNSVSFFGQYSFFFSISDCALIIGKGGGGGKPERGGGIGENHDEREGVARCKILYIQRGALLFSFPFIN